MGYNKEAVDGGKYFRIMKDGIYIGSHTVASANIQKADLLKRKTQFQKSTFSTQKAINISKMDEAVEEMDKIITIIGT